MSDSAIREAQQWLDEQEQTEQTQAEVDVVEGLRQALEMGPELVFVITDGNIGRVDEDAVERLTPRTEEGERQTLPMINGIQFGGGELEPWLAGVAQRTQGSDKGGRRRRRRLMFSREAQRSAPGVER